MSDLSLTVGEWIAEWGTTGQYGEGFKAQGQRGPFPDAAHAQNYLEAHGWPYDEKLNRHVPDVSAPAHGTDVKGLFPQAQVRFRRRDATPAERLAAAIAIPEIAAMREALESGDPPLPVFLEWIAARLVHKYGESKNMDFVLALERHAADAREALAALEKDVAPTPPEDAPQSDRART